MPKIQNMGYGDGSAGKALPHKCEDLSSDVQYSHRKLGIAMHRCALRAGEVETEDPWGLLVSQSI